MNTNIIKSDNLFVVAISENEEPEFIIGIYDSFLTVVKETMNYLKHNEFIKHMPDISGIILLSDLQDFIEDNFGDDVRINVSMRKLNQTVFDLHC